MLDPIGWTIVVLIIGVGVSKLVLDRVSDETIKKIADKWL